MNTALDSSPLNRNEVEMLRACEAQIERGRETFIRVGSALTAIRDGRLYRQTHATFEAYCAERWTLSRTQSYRLMDAAAVLGNLSPMGDKASDESAVLPGNERQARPLASLPAAEQRAAWNESVESAPRGPDGKPHVTAKHVKETLERRQQHTAAAARDSGPLKPAPAFDSPPTAQAPASPQATALDAVAAVATALKVEPEKASEAATTALRVLARRRMGTPPETLAKCIELLLRAIARGDA